MFYSVIKGTLFGYVKGGCHSLVWYFNSDFSRGILKFQASIQTLLGLQRFQISELYQDFSGMCTRFQVRPGKLDLLFCISHLLDLLANVVYTWQIYSTTSVKSGCGIVWKAIMTVEAAGLRGSGCWCETINLALVADASAMLVSQLDQRAR